ncbi:MAG: transglycosylase SLT domain-containing protein [Myxococcales bacterium]
MLRSTRTRAPCRRLFARAPEGARRRLPAALAVGVPAAVLGVGLLFSRASLAPAHADAVSSEAAVSAASFDPDVIKPASGSTLELVLRARRAGDLEHARSQAVAGLASADAHDEPALRWLAAQLTRELGATAEAAELLIPLAAGDHPLSLWARLSAAEWLEAKDPGRALALLDSLLSPEAEVLGFPGKNPAQRLRARVLGKLGRREEAIALFEQFVSELPDEALAIQVVVPLADLLAEGDEADRARALALYRRVAHRVPQTKVGVRSEQRVHEILKSLSEPLRSSLKEPSLEDKLLRADAMLAELRYDDARDAYAQLEKLSLDDPGVLCRARFGRAKAMLDGRARTEGVTVMASVAEECDQDPDRRAWARYHAGRAFSALGQNDLAIAQYEALEREAPAHRLADDALFRAAKVARDMGDSEGVFRRLSLLPARYPAGDMQARARFALAFQAYQQGDLVRAVEALASDRSDEPAEDVQGRAGYWYARFLAEAGQKQAAAHAFAEVCTRTPLSYYGQQAFARLSALDPARARALLADLPRAQAGKLVFPQLAEFALPGFERALALLSVGELNLGLTELRAIGLTSEATAERAFLVAALLERAGAPHLALEAARRRMHELLQRAPSARDLSLYELVYPRAFAPLIEDAAHKEGIPSAYLRAVAREESGFFPRAVSRAHAYGLIQLLVPTAKVIAKNLKLPHDATSLMRPEVNLPLGAHFIANLASGVRGQFALVPAAYNAGPAATARWLAERKQEPLDVWIENIPYDETRSYTRRVIQTHGVYHWLETGQMLQLPQEMPAL